MKLSLALMLLCFSWFVLANDSQTHEKIANESCQLVSVLDNGQTLKYNCSGEMIYKAADDKFGTVLYMEQHLDQNLTYILVRLVDIGMAYIKTLGLEFAYYFQILAKPCQVKREIVTEKAGRPYLHLLVENAKNNCDVLGQIGAIIDSMEEWLGNHTLFCKVWCIRKSDDGTWEALILTGIKNAFSLESCANYGTSGPCKTMSDAV